MKRGVRGAATAEFVIAIVPVLMLFFATAQYSVLAVGKIVTKHAAYLGARAAIVACSEPGGGDAQGEIDKAVMTAFGPVLKIGRPTAAITSGSCSQTSQSMLTVTVTAPLNCAVPLGGRLLCAGATTKTIKASASLPNQGSYANVVWGAK